MVAHLMGECMKQIWGSSVIVIAAACLPAAAQAQDGGATFAQHRTFNIAPSDLRTGITQFSQTTGVQVIIAPADARGLRTAGVRGAHSVREALDILLRGTGLSPSIRGSVAVLKPARPRSRETSPARPTQDSAVTDTSEPLSMLAPTEVVVTGYRESLQRAQDLKRTAVGSEDDILAQDIASFPDLNLAESLQRIPGITITRDSGEGRQIALRGLGPDFTRTQLNGMEVLGNTASGMDNRGGASRTRAFDYSLFASELFNRVAVQKSYSADQDEGGIAGTVQLYTAKPFDYDGSKFVLGVKGQTNTNTSGVTPRVVALASNRWGDFGALISVAYSQIKSNEYGYRNWGWNPVHYDPGNIGPDVDPSIAARLQIPQNELTGNPDAIFAPQAESPSTWYTDRRRLGVTSSLQYHPGDTFKLDVDLLYGRLWDYRNDYALASAGANSLTGSPIAGDQILESAVVDHNTLRAASYDHIDLRSEHHTIKNHTDFYQGAANLSWKPTDRLTLTALGGYEESDFREPQFDKVFMEAKDTTFSFDDRPDTLGNTYGIDLTDPDNWDVQRLDTQENSITTRYANGKLNAVYALNDTSKLEVGGEFKHFINSGYQYNHKVFHNVPADTPVPNDLKELVGPDTMIQYIVGDVDGVYDYIGDPRDLDASNLQAGSDFRVDEKTWSGYVQYDMDVYVGAMRLRANMGVRYYSTDLTSSGHLATGSAFEPVSISTNSHGWLPAINIALDLTPKLVLRGSANRNVSRPGLGDLAAAGSITTRPNGGSVSFGNPYLKPYEATSAEGSLEYYMDRSGFASIGFFYKQMDSFVTSSTIQEPFGQTGLPSSLLIQGEDANTIFDVSQPINGPGADIKGIEAAVQHDFTFLPGALKHLGMVVNGTWFDGHQQVKLGDDFVRLPLFNLSKWAANATLYYENSTWGIRVSDAYRSQYLTSGGGNGNVGDGIKGTNNIDFQGHFNLSPNIRLVVEGLNLTNEPIEQFADVNADRTEVYTTSGRTFTFGVTASF